MMHPILFRSRGRWLAVAAALSLAPPMAWAGQNPAANAAQTQDDDGSIRLHLPPITVTAEKVPETIVDAPVSVTAVTKPVLDAAAVRTVSDAADFAPNTFFTEFSARKLSAPRFRGIGASPNNPGIATYIDGVPQFNANSSSIELLDVDQIEFVRGAQSPLFGRNSIGGLINIHSAVPSTSQWSGSLAGPVGNFATADVRGSAAGPLKSNRLGLGVSFGYNRREGFTENDVTGHDLDSRSGTFGKAHLLWVPNGHWAARVIFSAERDRDGDYSLGDLGGLRSNPFHVSRDYEGFTHRDVMAPTVVL
jgi:iron complex outermembrane receptor protein